MCVSVNLYPCEIICVFECVSMFIVFVMLMGVATSEGYCFCLSMSMWVSTLAGLPFRMAHKGDEPDQSGSMEE